MQEYDDIIQKAVNNLNENLDSSDTRKPISFAQFLKNVADDPSAVIRSVFQVFHDMMEHFVGDGYQEYVDDPENVGFLYYDFNQLLVDETDRPFFADRLFGNRLMELSKAMRRGAQQNKIYIFEGPPGCGKSTFLNNLLSKFENYANTRAGHRYEVIWRLDRHALGGLIDAEILPAISHYHEEAGEEAEEEYAADLNNKPLSFHETDEYIEIPCLNHDSPLLLIPKNYRREFFDNLFQNNEFKYKLFTEKEYEWVFRDNPCTICTSLFKALASRLDSPSRVYEMVFAGEHQFDRRLGVGVTVFNPGDRPLKQSVLTNDMLQRRLDALFKDSNRVRYVYSPMARTNNGIYALMDIKNHNRERLIELHNIISEGVHKVEHVEENINSLFIALMNPEDKKNLAGLQSFQDRIEYIRVPYVMDLQTEVEIYRNIFGKHIDANFLPKVLHNFARVIISTRLSPRSDALLEWIKDPKKYERYCDKNLHLLKMEIYTGNIPSWLSEEDLKKFTAQVRKMILKESDNEGEKGYSGRDSLKIFNEFYSTFASETKLINMAMLKAFFDKKQKEQPGLIPAGFIESLCDMYDYNILQEVKECLFYYNAEKISADIRDYMCAVNYDTGADILNTFTGRRFTVTEDFFKSIENFLLGDAVDSRKRQEFRKDIQKTYTSKTLTQEMMVEGIPIEQTSLFNMLREKYEFNLKEKVLDPFLKNENFRRAIKDFGTEEFRTYDNRIREDVTFLIGNLNRKYFYTEKGAREVCMYVVDNDLARKFGRK